MIALLVILTSFSGVVANAEPNTQNSESVAPLAVCDHNGDHVRNLSDVGMFAQCKDTFDANGDGIHDLLDVSAYAANNQNDNWCATEFHCQPVPNKQEDVVISDPLILCDHNGDGKRDVSDAGIFTSCKDTFDANGDNVHDLTDVSLYAQNYDDPYFCAHTFVCQPEEKSTLSTEVSEPVVDTLNVCDHNKDGKRNVSDVGMFAQCKDTFDVNGDNIHDVSDLGLYTTNSQNDKWCESNFVCNPAPVASKATFGAGISAPDPSNIEASVSCDQVDISWDTSKDSLTWLVYGEDTSYGDEYKSDNYASQHLVTLSDLPYDTTYNYMVKTQAVSGDSKDDYNYSFTTPSAEQCGQVLGEKIVNEEELVVEEPEVCTYMTPDQDVLGQTEWADGTLLRGCGPEVYRIENQQKRHIKDLAELLQYIGQRIYNVTNDVLNLF